MNDAEAVYDRLERERKLKPRHTCITDDGGTPGRACGACEEERTRADVASQAQPMAVPAALAEQVQAFAAQGLDAVNALRELIHRVSATRLMPVDFVRWVPAAMVQPNDYNPNAVARVEMQLLLRSILADGYCVEASVPVLCDDLVWRAAGDLRPGIHRVVGVSEQASTRKQRRRYELGHVTSNAVEPSPLLRVVTTHGEMRTTPDHPWLARKRQGAGALAFGSYDWRRADALSPGWEVAFAMEPWVPARTWEAGWLAGFLDGEGTLATNQSTARTGCRGVRLAGYQRPGPTADRMVQAMRSVVPTATVFTVERSESSRWSDMVMCRIDPMRDIMRLLGTVRPSRLLEARAEPFWAGARLEAETATVLAVEEAGQGEIARLATSCHTYIAGGFVQHNTQPVVTIWDPERAKFIVVDGFHRFYIVHTQPEVQARTGGRLPIVVIEKSITERMASTVRHNRARGKHSTDGMANMIFAMLEQGMTDAEICNELGMEAEELVRLKHITGFSKLFENVDYNRAWVTRTQVRAKLAQDGVGFGPKEETP